MRVIVFIEKMNEHGILHTSSRSTLTPISEIHTISANLHIQTLKPAKTK